MGCVAAQGLTLAYCEHIPLCASHLTPGLGRRSLGSTGRALCGLCLAPRTLVSDKLKNPWQTAS